MKPNLPLIVQKSKEIQKTNHQGIEEARETKAWLQTQDRKNTEKPGVQATAQQNKEQAIIVMPEKILEVPPEDQQSVE